MPFRFRDDLAGGDVGFEATGQTEEELFISAAEATMNVMVERLDAIHRNQEIGFEVEHPEFDMLLFRFLNELIFLKDAKQLLVRIEKVSFGRKDSVFTLEARGYGEIINPEQHPLNVDVKAVTLHRFRVSRTNLGWEATVVLDV